MQALAAIVLLVVVVVILFAVYSYLRGKYGGVLNVLDWFSNPLKSLGVSV